MPWKSPPEGRNACSRPQATLSPLTASEHSRCGSAWPAKMAPSPAAANNLVRQEFYGLMMTHFAVRGLMHEAALKAGEDPDRLSFLHAVRVVRRKLPHFVAIPPSAEKSVS